MKCHKLINYNIRPQDQVNVSVKSSTVQFFAIGDQGGMPVIYIEA